MAKKPLTPSKDFETYKDKSGVTVYRKTPDSEYRVKKHKADYKEMGINDKSAKQSARTVEGINQFAKAQVLIERKKKGVDKTDKDTLKTKRISDKFLNEEYGYKVKSDASNGYPKDFKFLKHTTKGKS